jgi:hypothetical protein
MSLEQDVAAARTAVDEVERACARVAGHFRENIDSRRLRLGVTHVRQDLDLLCSATLAAVQGRHYASAAWDDGMDDAGSLSRATR